MKKIVFPLLLSLLPACMIAQNFPSTDSLMQDFYHSVYGKKESLADRVQVVAGLLIRTQSLDSIKGELYEQAKDMLSLDTYTATYELVPGKNAFETAGVYSSVIGETSTQSDAFRDWTTRKLELKELLDKGWTETPYTRSGNGYDDDWLQTYWLNYKSGYLTYSIQLILTHVKDQAYQILVKVFH